MAKVLLIGSTGQLGRALVQCDLGEISFLTRSDLDLLKTDQIFETLSRHSFDILINASAYNSTELAEKDPEEAFLINAHAVGKMARSCKEKGAVFVHVSTDYVFDGKSDIPYTEEDRVCPLNLYGCSKVLGEQLVKEELIEHYILRTAALYGDGSSNFVKKIVAKSGQADVVDDIVMSPTSAYDLASWIVALLNKKAPFGLYHAVSRGEVSWHQFASKIVEFSKSDLIVKPVKSNSSGMKRPKYSALNPTKLEKVVGPINSWEEGLKYYVSKR